MDYQQMVVDLCLGMFLAALALGAMLLVGLGIGGWMWLG